MKAVEQYFLVVLFIMLYKKLVLTFEPVDEILQIKHSNPTAAELYSVVLSCNKKHFRNICSLVLLVGKALRHVWIDQ